jgi:pyruvate dehydrogenase E2 component (dihydrolipoamide acetyltransferase)
MEAGTLTEWRVGPGSVFTAATCWHWSDAKGIIDIESFEAGTVERLLINAGERVPVGAPLAVLAGEGAAPTPTSAPAPTAATGMTADAPRPRISPAARARASLVECRLCMAPDRGCDHAGGS